MEKWTTGPRAALITILLWGGGGFAIGCVMEVIDEFTTDLPVVAAIDIWPFTAAMPAAIAGTIFVALVMAIARCEIAELSIARAALWSVPAGLATGVLAASLGFGGRFSSDDVVGSVMLIGLAVALSLLAAAGSVTLFRRVTDGTKSSRRGNSIGGL